MPAMPLRILSLLLGGALLVASVVAADKETVRLRDIVRSPAEFDGQDFLYEVWLHHRDMRKEPLVRGYLAAIGDGTKEAHDAPFYGTREELISNRLNFVVSREQYELIARSVTRSKSVRRTVRFEVETEDIEIQGRRRKFYVARLEVEAPESEEKP